MASGYFLPRMARRIQFLVSSVIQREISDPRLGLVTVLKVEPTSDLKEAKVYVSIFGKPGEQSRTFRALEDARGFIQREVGRNLETKNTPRLWFVLDESQDKVSRIEALVEQAQEDREDVMAKKPQKKQEKAVKGASPKPQKPAPKPATAPKAPEKMGGAKPAVSKGEAAKELKASKPQKGERGPKGFGSHSPEDLQPKKRFPTEDSGEEDEDKDSTDDLETKEEEEEEEEEEVEEEDEEEEEEEEEEEKEVEDEKGF